MLSVSTLSNNHGAPRVCMHERERLRKDTLTALIRWLSGEPIQFRIGSHAVPH